MFLLVFQNQHGFDPKPLLNDVHSLAIGWGERARGQPRFLLHGGGSECAARDPFQKHWFVRSSTLSLLRWKISKSQQIPKKIISDSFVSRRRECKRGLAGTVREQVKPGTFSSYVIMVQAQILLLLPPGPLGIQ